MRVFSKISPILPICAVFLLSSPLCWAKERVKNSHRDHQVKLAAELTDVAYSGAGDIRVALLRFSLIFVNQGQDDVILFRTSRIDKGEFARNTRELAKGELEADVMPHRLVDGSELFENLAPVFSDAPDFEQFVILKHHEQYRTTAEFAVSITTGPVPPNRKILGQGKHVIRILVSNWPFSEEAGKKLQDRWKATGTLFTGSVRSSPLSIELSVPHQQLKSAPSAYQNNGVCAREDSPRSPFAPSRPLHLQSSVGPATTKD